MDENWWGRAVLVGLFCTGCDGGVGQPLPAGGLPRAQTVEGGIQMRVTAQGLDKIESVLFADLQAALDGATLCLPEQNHGGGNLETRACHTDAGACSPGCPIALDLSNVQISAPNPQTMRVAVQLDASGPVRVEESSFGVVTNTCDATFTASDAVAEGEIVFRIDLATGLVTTEVESTEFSPNGQLQNCTLNGASSANVVADLNDTLNNEFLTALWLPFLEDLRSQLAPDGEATGVLEETEGMRLELRFGAGGYFALQGAGASVGIITGINTDEDPATRTPALASEPDLCVLSLPPLDLGASPYSLAATGRGTFALPPDGIFASDAANPFDFAFGVSRTTLDQLGHHRIASGFYCFAADDTGIAQLRRDVLDDLAGVPLAGDDAPVRVTVRPSSAIRHVISGGNDPVVSASWPALSLDVAIDDGGGFVDALTVTADVELDYGVVIRRYPGTSWALEPIQRNLRVVNPSTEVSAARYQEVDADQLGDFMTSLYHLILAPVDIANPPVELPDVAGFSHQAIVPPEHVATSVDDFIAIRTELTLNPYVAGPQGPAPAPADISVDAGSVAELHAALSGGGGALPQVTIPMSGAVGFRIGNGPWRHADPLEELVIADPIFAWQGEHVIDLRFEADDGSVSESGQISVTIDYAPPTIFEEDIVVGADSIAVPARDTITETDDLERAIAAVGAPVPATFTSGSAVELGPLTEEPAVVVYVRDEAGNVASATVDLGNGGGGEGGGGEGGSQGGGPPTPGGGGGEGGETSAADGEEGASCDCRVGGERNAYGCFACVAGFAVALARRRRAGG